MAQVACVKVPASGWVKMEDLIKEQLDKDAPSDKAIKYFRMTNF